MTLLVIGASPCGLVLVMRSDFSISRGHSPPPLYAAASTPPPTAIPLGPQKIGVAPALADSSVFDISAPSIAKLDPYLLGALRKAAMDAETEGVKLSINSGWRSHDHQDRLLREAIEKYGSATEAARWVATSDTSLHVTGDAVDIGTAGAAWLAEHGARYGLCQVYSNEPWHFELVEGARTYGCPVKYADASEDPRMTTGAFHRAFR